MTDSAYNRLRHDILDRLGCVCVGCGNTDRRILQIDHRFGGGAEERRLLGSGVAYLKHIQRNLWSGNYQILCPNCNTIKRHTNYECVRSINVEVIDDLWTLALEYDNDTYT